MQLYSSGQPSLRADRCHRSTYQLQCAAARQQRHHLLQCKALEQTKEQQQMSKHASWSQRLLAAGLAAAVAASAILQPAATPPAAVAEAMMSGGMEHSAEQHTHAAPGTAAAQFSCTPLTPQERASYINLYGFSHKIHTSSPDAQALFNQGLLLTYNFNRPEAIRSFQAGLQLDPDAAMLHWGLAHAQGPYANKVWGPAPPDHSFETITPGEVQQAKADAQVGLAAARAALSSAPSDPRLQSELSYLEAENELWSAVKSYDDPAIYKALEQYAARLEAIAEADPSDADALGMAAEARMNISPWVHWKGPIYRQNTSWLSVLGLGGADDVTFKLLRRQPVKPDSVVMPALRDIREALGRQPGHPMASHLMIHLTEAGTPGKGLPAEPGYAALGESAADSLATDHPYASMGHLSHMPAHTYIRVGRWHDAIKANEAALSADAALVGRCVMPYMPEHNSQQLLYAAMNTGQLGLAERKALDAVDFPKHYGPTVMADGRERISQLLIWARFAKWDPILQLPLSDLDYSMDGIMVPPTAEGFGRSVYHYVRGLAFASAAAHAHGDDALQSQQQIQQEVSLLSAAADAIPEDVVTRPGEGLGVPSPGFKHLAQMELLAARARGDVLLGDLSAAAKKLETAIAIDQTLGYTEPPRQYQPMQECLGWVLLQQGKLKQAEQVYLEDLVELPENPWALKGLQQVYMAQGGSAADKLHKVEARLSTAWSHADEGVELHSSCPSFSD